MIDVRDLCFHYQGSKHQVFSHFALQLNPGRVYGHRQVHPALSHQRTAPT